MYLLLSIIVEMIALLIFIFFIYCLLMWSEDKKPDNKSPTGENLSEVPSEAIKVDESNSKAGKDSNIEDQSATDIVEIVEPLLQASADPGCYSNLPELENSPIKDESQCDSETAILQSTAECEIQCKIGAKKKRRKKKRKNPKKVITPTKIDDTSKECDSNANPTKIDDTSTECNFNATPTAFFLTNASSDGHHEAQQNHRDRYLATVLHMVKTNVEILPSAKVKMLCCAWVRKDREMVDTFLGMKKVFNFVEVAKSLNILDIPRQVRALEKKLEKLKKLVDEKKISVKKATYRKLEKKIALLKSQMIKGGSVSGAVSKRIREWASKFTQSELEYMAMNFDPQVWKEMADIVHLNPDKIAAPWFLRFMIDGVAPDDSAVSKAKDVNETNVNEILKTTPLPFHKISEYKNNLTNESKAIIVKNEDNVGRVLWNYEYLICKEVDKVISDRLNKEKTVDFGYGKLMERLMMLKPLNVPFYQQLMDIAEMKLKEYTHNLEGPIGVLADASSSMEVAIKIATITSSFLTVFTNAKLVFFNDNYWSPAKNPNTITDVINLALNTKACGCTSPAAALWPFYEAKTRLKTIIVVTDEEENTSYKDYGFAALFQKYTQEVGPCELIFISFLHSQHSRGQMVEELRTYNIKATTYVFNTEKPDISKLDSIIGKMSLNDVSFVETITLIESAIAKKHLKEVFGNLGQ